MSRKIPVAVLAAVWAGGILYLLNAPSPPPPAGSISISRLARIGIFAAPAGLLLLKFRATYMIENIAWLSVIRSATGWIAAEILTRIIFPETDSLARTFLVQFTAVYLLLDREPAAFIQRITFRDVFAGFATSLALLAVLSAAVLAGPLGDIFIGGQAWTPRHLPELILAIICIPYLEEILFRGGVMGLFKSRAVAVVFSAVLFAALHAQDQIFLARFLGGLAMGWLYLRTGNISASFVLHAITNAGVIFAPRIF